MVKNFNLKAVYFLLIIAVLISCGGSGGGGSSNGTNVLRATDPVRIGVNSGITEGTLERNQSTYFNFYGTESTTYQITLDSVEGDVDIAVFSSDVLSEETIIVLSANPTYGSITQDSVIFTAPATQLFYIEIAAFLNSEFTLSINEVPEDQIGFSLSHDETNFMSVRNKHLPAAFEVEVNYPPGRSVTVADTIAFPDSMPGWLDYEVILNSGIGASDSVSFNIISNSEPVGSYSTTARIYAEQGDSTRYPAPNISIFKEITIDYSLFDIDAPSEVNHGQSYQFALEKPELDSNELGITMISGPTSMSLSNDGIINWTPHGPMFDTTLDVNWTLGLDYKLATYEITSTTRVNDASRQRPLFRSPIATPKMPNGAEIADFDGDGIRELLLTDNKKQVYTLEYQNGSYVHDWSLPTSLYEWRESPLQTANVLALASADVNNDGNPDIIVGYSTKIVILDGVTKRQISSIEDGFDYRRDMIAANLTNSNTVTLVYLVRLDSDLPGVPYEYRIIAYDLSDTNNPVQVLQTETLYFIDDNGRDYSFLTIDNVDADANLEIISASGEIFDGESFVVQDNFPIAGGEDEVSHILAADVNNDGAKEVVICCKRVPYSTQRLLGYSTITQSFVWESLPIEPSTVNSVSRVNAMTAGNIDSSQEEEIVVQGNDLFYIYKNDANTGLPILSWTSSNIGFPHTLLVANVDNDNAKELISIGSLSSLTSNLSVFEFSTNSLIHQWELPSIEYNGSYTGGMWTKIAPDKQEAVFVNSNAAYARATRLISLSNLGLMSIGPVIGENNLTNKSLINKSDYDNDGVEEIFVSSAELLDDFLVATDFSNNTTEWMSPLDLGEGIAIKYADMNNDSYDDLVVMVNPAGPNTVWYIFDMVNTVTIGSFYLVDIYPSDFDIVESQNSDIFNIVFIEGNRNRIHKYDYIRSTNQLTNMQSGSFDAAAAVFLVADIDDDGNKEIILEGGNQFQVMDFDFNLLNEYEVDTFWSVSQIYKEHDEINSKNIFITINTGDNSAPSRSAFVRLIDAMNGNTIWESPALIGSAQNDSLNMVDSDSDGSVDFLTIGTREGMYITR